jgi:hypothetical protein
MELLQQTGLKKGPMMQKKTDAQTFPNEWDQFVQNKIDYYSKIFRSYESNGTKEPWNWAAAIFGVYWFAYRKMHRRARIFLIAYIAITALQIIIIANSMFVPISVFFELGMFLYFGTTGNHNYFLHVNRTIKKIKELEANNNYMVDWYTKSGGTSILSVIGFCLAMAAAEVIIVIVVFVIL